MLRRQHKTIVNDAGTLFLCKRNCDARYPFNRDKRRACKYQCELAETVEALSQIADVTTVTTSEGTQITSVEPTVSPDPFTGIDPRQTTSFTATEDLQDETPVITPVTTPDNGRIAPSDMNQYILPIGLAIGAVVVYKILTPSKKRKKR